MIDTINIQNFKSITDLSLELGRINVFIGANGSGKSNILEAIGMAAAGKAERIEVTDMISKGIRIAKPDLMFSSFFGQPMNHEISLKICDNYKQLWYSISNEAPAEIFSHWKYSIAPSFPESPKNKGINLVHLEMQGYKLGRSKSNLYFKDRFMQKKNNLFSAENANEGALELLFFLTLFTSQRTPSFFAIDNIETGLNPRLCRYLIKSIADLAKTNQKQALITTHNPAILDGLNLYDDNQRLFIVNRNDEGNTTVKRIKLKPQTDDVKETAMLSELWIKGFLS